MAKIHVGILGWRPESLEKTIGAVAKSFAESKFIICCKQQDMAKTADLAKQAGADALVFSPQEARNSLGAPGALGCGQEITIGAKRNLLQLASAALDSHMPLVLLDDDVLPDGATSRAFAASFAKYDLVQGRYSGSIGNKIYAAVRFFEILSELSASQEFEALVDNGLRGVVSAGAQSRSLASATGGLLGISENLLAQNCFAPTSYMFDDHFFEFSSRYLFRSLRFMGEGTAPDEIPIAIHRSLPASHRKLVDDYILYVKAAVVESYYYFRLCGSIPVVRNSRHALQPAQGFDARQHTLRAMQEAALEKFQAAARGQLSKISG
ncbi:hypothetical protein FJZ26_02495, partial [Candidatus Parvarchaeota archaeon]|nr:hypothetical protein [Candidatus Parvarchaeota archaeon]